MTKGLGVIWFGADVRVDSLRRIATELRRLKFTAGELTRTVKYMSRFNGLYTLL